MYSSRRWHAALITMTVAAALGACGSDGGSAAADPAAAPAPSTAPSTAPTSTPADSSGDGTDTPDATESSAPGWPTCETVWSEGADLPKGYAGCTDGEESVGAEIVDCSSGQRIVVYADHYWAVRGHVIGFAPEGLRDDSEYAHDLYSCRA